MGLDVVSVYYDALLCKVACNKNTREYDQKIPQSHTADKLTAYLQQVAYRPHTKLHYNLLMYHNAFALCAL